MATRWLLRRRRREVARLPVSGADTVGTGHAHTPIGRVWRSLMTLRADHPPKGSGIGASANALIREFREFRECG